MKRLVCFCKLESDVLAKFTIKLKSQPKQYKAITLRNVSDGSVLMACTATFLLSKYQFFTHARIIQHLMVMHSAHNERKRETIVKSLLEN